jgi:hypothetical protein
MIATIDDLIKALQKFPKTAKVQADHKSIQSVSSSGSTTDTVEISTTATT